MAFQNGTDRGGFKKSLMAAFASAHKQARGGPHPTTAPTLPTAGFNRDTRAAGLEPGGHQAGKVPNQAGDGEVLGGESHPSPATTARGPVNHNNDPRRIGLEVAGNQTKKIQLTGGSATNSNKLLPKGHQVNKIRLPQNQNVDARNLRGR